MLLYLIENSTVTVEFYANPNYIVKAGADKIRLTGVESELLHLLLKEQSVSREQCESILWEHRVVADTSRSLTQAVSTLRGKLEQCGAAGLLVTKPRWGYTLASDWRTEIVIDSKASDRFHAFGPHNEKENLIHAVEAQDGKEINKLVYTLITLSLLLSLLSYYFDKKGQYKYEVIEIDSKLVDILGSKDKFRGDSEFTIEDDMIGVEMSTVYVTCKYDNDWYRYKFEYFAFENIEWGHKEIEKIYSRCDIN